MNTWRNTRRNIMEYMVEVAIIIGILMMKEDIMCDTCRALWNRFHWPTSMCVDTFLWWSVLLVGILCIRKQVIICANLLKMCHNFLLDIVPKREYNLIMAKRWKRRDAKLKDLTSKEYDSQLQ